MTLTRPLLITLTVSSAIACGDGDADDPARCEATEIAVGDSELYPEGIARDAEGALYISSLTTGAITRAEPCGEVTELVPTTGLSSVGLLVDGDVLWACQSDLSFQTAPALVAYDRETGAELERHTLGAPGSFCNDLTLEPGTGAPLVTDSTGHGIYRLGSSLELLASDPQLEVPAGQFGLNGIAATGDDVLVVSYATGQLFRLRDGAVTEIELDRALAGPDGLEVLDDGSLLVVEGNAGALTRVVIDGDNATTAVIASGLDVPSTAVVDGDHAWVVESQLDHLLGIDPAPPTTPFRVVRAAVAAR